LADKIIGLRFAFRDGSVQDCRKKGLFVLETAIERADGCVRETYHVTNQYQVQVGVPFYQFAAGADHPGQGLLAA